VLIVTAALVATAALAFGAGPASSASSCGSAVINDWYVDGTIDYQYPSKCYREALAKVPESQKIYSDLPDKLERGLRAALVREARGGVKSATKTITQSGRQLSSHKKSGPIQQVLGELGPDRADSIPVPLMILAGVALLLIAAGATSVVVRRVNGRRNS
jgi:hypothetical protein